MSYLVREFQVETDHKALIPIFNRDKLENNIHLDSSDGDNDSCRTISQLDANRAGRWGSQTIFQDILKGQLLQINGKKKKQ